MSSSRARKFCLLASASLFGGSLACDVDVYLGRPDPGPLATDAGAPGTLGAGGQADTPEAQAGASGVAPACLLRASGPVVATRDGQVISGLSIVAKGEPAIRVAGFSKVRIENVRIDHEGAAGILFTDAPDLKIDGVSVEHSGAPVSGQNPSSTLNNIEGHDSPRASISNVYLTGGSAGIYLVQSPDSLISNAVGKNMRGPAPRGQFVQLNGSNGVSIQDFYVENDASSWPSAGVDVYNSHDAHIARGLIDGNNDPSGVGVVFNGGSSSGVVDDVDAVHMGNGCFSALRAAPTAQVVFRRTRCRDNICKDQGRGVPLSGGIMWTGSPDGTAPRLEQSSYFDACGPLTWPTDGFMPSELTEEDFTVRQPVSVRFCWE